MTTDYGIARKKKSSKALRWLYVVFVVLMAVAGMALATQLAAEHYGYQPALGKPLFVAANRFWYWPWSIVSWVQQGDPDGYLEHAASLGQLLFIGPQLVILGLWLSSNQLRGNSMLHGSAGWASLEEIDGMGFLRGEGVYIGAYFKKLTGKALLMAILTFSAVGETLYLRHNGPEHILVFAPTRSGKGVGLILPTLLSWLHSAFILDIKGENWALTSGWRRSLGHTTLRFDPTDATGASASFNPLDEMRLGTLYVIQDVQNLAQMLVDPEGKGLGDHWSKAALALFCGIILHNMVKVPAQTGNPASLFDITQAMADESMTIKETLEEMLEYDHAAEMTALNPAWAESGKAVHAFVASSAREMLNKAENEASGVLSSALVNMSLYRDPIIALNTAKSDFHIDDLMNAENPVDLYMVIPPSDSDRVKPLTRLMLDMIVRKRCRKMEFADGTSKAGYKHRMLLMLDEFTSLGKMAFIEKALAFMAGYGLKAYIIVQDIAQLNNIYGKDNEIMGNCHIRAAYAPNKIETGEVLSKMAGTTTVVEKKKSISGKGSSRSVSWSISEVARPLLTPDECMRLPASKKDSQGRVKKPGDMLIFTAGEQPIYGRQILYFQDPVFSARAKMPAPGLSEKFPAGITDSLYYPRPEEWYGTFTPTPQPEASAENKPKAKTLEDYMNEDKAA